MDPSSHNANYPSRIRRAAVVADPPVPDSGMLKFWPDLRSRSARNAVLQLMGFSISTASTVMPSGILTSLCSSPWKP